MGWILRSGGKIEINNKEVMKNLRVGRGISVLFFMLVLSLPAFLVWQTKLVQKRVFFEKQAVDGGSENYNFVPDKIFGQPDFTETVPNQVVGNRVFHPQGVLVDRNSSPDKVYIWDSGNSRILGFSSLGVCLGGSKSGQPCTNNSDCPNSTCQINPTKEADLVIGQVDRFHASCNGDSTQKMPASASTLCSQPYPDVISLMESPEGNSLAVDNNHNLYVYDKLNNRVLKYNDPFATDKIADFVCGQANISDREKYGGKENINNRSFNW